MTKKRVTNEDLPPAMEKYTDAEKAEILRRGREAGLILDRPRDPDFPAKIMRAVAENKIASSLTIDEHTTREEITEFVRANCGG